MPIHPFIPFAGVAKAEFRYTLAGQQVENVIYVKGESTPMSTDSMRSIGDVLSAWYTVNEAPLVVTHIVLNEIKLTAMDTFDGPALSYTDGLPVAGTSTGTGLPNNVSLAVKLSSESRGRSATGRWFIAGIPVGVLSDANTVSSGWAGFQKAAFDALILAFGSTTFRWVIASYRTHNEWRTVGATHDVSGISVDRTVDSQRRRLPGRGR